VNDLTIEPDYLLIDGFHLPNVTQPQAPVAGGDTQSCSIAAAAVVARTVRDEYMIEMDRLYPQYGFASHKGYGTPEHRAALARYGPCPIHRPATAGERDVLSLTAGFPFGDE
jgi:ribonuclease HII